MNRITRNIKKNASLFFIALGALILSVASCKKTEYKSPQEYLDEENELLVRYYDEQINKDEEGNLINDSTRLEIMTAAAIDTVDHRFESGMMLFHLEQGRGDLITANKQIGYRFKRFVITENDTTKVTYDIELGDNYTETSPVLFTTQSLVYSDYELKRRLGSIPAGVNEAAQYMRLGGKGRVVMPSTINGESGYFSTMLEFEITYIGQD